MFSFSFGYSMEHPKLLEAVDFMGRIGSPSAGFLQFDGMKFRTDDELRELLSALHGHGVRLLGLTFYGTESYHDAFAGRIGDFDLLYRTFSAAKEVGLDVEAHVILTHENTGQIGALAERLLGLVPKRFSLLVPHEEGRGVTLRPIQFSARDYMALPEWVKKYFNSSVFKTEGEWASGAKLRTYNSRALFISLTPRNIDGLEMEPFEDTIANLERLDDSYYEAMPGLDELLDIYGNSSGGAYYSQRSLYLHYQKMYIHDHGLRLYDINDERQHFVRRIPT